LFPPLGSTGYIYESVKNKIRRMRGRNFSKDRAKLISPRPNLPFSTFPSEKLLTSRIIAMIKANVAPLRNKPKGKDPWPLLRVYTRKVLTYIPIWTKLTQSFPWFFPIW